MSNINKTAAAGVVFFTLILAGFVAIKVDQTTIALLGGALIGIVIAIPTTILMIVIGRRESGAGQVRVPEQTEVPLLTTVNHYHDHKYVVVVNVPVGADAVVARWTVARELRTTPLEAKRMIEAGEVRCLPVGSE